MEILRSIVGPDNPDPEAANPRKIREDGDVLVDMTNDGSVYLQSEDVHIDRDRRSVFVNGNLLDITGTAPTEIHLPAENKTAAHNLEEKSEQRARILLPVARYSKVVNPSNRPEEEVPLNVPYVEIWF